MALSVKKFTFTKTTSTATPVSQEVNVTNFTPKILILWGSGQTTEGTYEDHWSMHFGFSDGTTSRVQTARSQDNTATGTTTFMVRNDAIVSILSPTVQSTELSRAQVTSFDSDGFTLSWGVQTDTTAMVIHGIAIGGSDITNVKVVNDTVQRATTGSQTYTGAGFTPNFVMTMAGYETQTINNFSTASWGFHIGAAKSSSERMSLACRSEAAATTSDTDQSLGSHTNAVCVHTLDQTNGTITSVADLTAFTSDGCTLNWTNASSATTNLLGFLYVAGGHWDVGGFNQRSGTGTQNVTLDTAFDPQAILLMGINSAAVGGVAVNNYIGVGGSDGTTEGCVWCGDQNSVADMVTARVNLTTKAYRQATPNATSGSSTTDAECDMNDMTTAGQFTLDWTTASSTLVHVAFIAVGVSLVSQTNIHKYHIFQDIAQASIHKYNMIGNVVQQSIHKYHLFQNAIAESIHKYNMIGNALADSIHKYHIRQDIMQASIHKYHLFQEAVAQSIHKYNVIGNAIADSIHKYNVIGNAIADSIHKYNVLAFTGAAQSIHKYNVLNDVVQQTIHKYHLFQNAVQENIHKYNIIGIVASANIHKYDMAGVIASQSIQKYHVLVDVVTQSIHKYHLFQIAALASIHKYNVVQNAIAQSIHKYNVIADVAAATIHKYNVLANTVAQSIHKYNVVQNILAESIHKYNVLQNVALASIHKYHIFAIAAATSIHPYIIGQKVKKLISALGSGKAIELSNGAKLLQQFIKDRWPTS